MTNRIFITKTEKELEEIRPVLEKAGNLLFAFSFLRFQGVPINMDTHDFPIIFFSSKRAAQYFLKQNSIHPKQLVACVGQSTANYLLGQSIHVSFVGTDAGNPYAIGKELKVWADGKKIFFPISDRSKHSITQLFNSEQILEVICYQTEIVSAEIPACDIYVFTSPSNAEGFLKENQLPDSSVIIAWGKTTESYLASRDIVANYTLKQSTKAELISYLLNEHA